MKEEQGKNKEECEGKQWEGEGKRGQLSEECEKNRRVRGGRKRTKKRKGRTNVITTKMCMYYEYYVRLLEGGV